ncbi:MAG: hypothetical protein FJZ01_18570 [Candidatus Sericytochromatia bacterium]|nr:hypothetical protein [Candidatus Tanganyikabacteria bacterium]
MSNVHGPGGPREPMRLPQNQPAVQQPPSLRPAEPPPPAAIKVDSSQVTSRLHGYDVIDNPLLSSMRIAMVAAFDPGAPGDVVRKGMASANPAKLREGLQIKRSDGKSPWDRMEPRVQQLLASDQKNRALAFKGFITNKGVDDLVKVIKKTPAGPEARQLERSITNMTEMDAQKAADAISGVDSSPQPQKVGSAWAEQFRMFATGQTLPVFI